MGNAESISTAEASKLSQQTSCFLFEFPSIKAFYIFLVNEKTIKQIHKKFTKLDKANKGHVESSDLIKLPEICKNPLGERIAEIMQNSKENPEIEFQKFLKTLDDFNKEVLFQIYDLDGDGFINEKELYTVMKLMVGNDLNDQQLKEIVSKTLEEADQDKDGKLNFEEFLRIIIGQQ